MSVSTIAFLLGLFVVPTYLLWAGHHWRSRSSRVRGAFWGGVIAHTLAALVSSGVALFNPVHWSAGETLRGFFGYWLMLVAGLIGMLIGAWRGGRSDS